MDIHLDLIKNTITYTRVLRNVLTVHATLEMRKYARQKKIMLSTNEILRVIESEYNVVEVLKNDRICNWNKSSISCNGTWKFKIKKQPVKKQKQKEVAPTPVEIVVEEKVEEAPKQEVETKKNEKNTSKKASFRGRIKKLASKN